jgi:hypothetical protein
MFPRIHAGALGAAVGLTAGVALCLLTVVEVLLDSEMPLGLLSWYLIGYHPTWSGALVGLAWGTVIGFAAGWLLGTVHNATIGAWVLVLRARTDLSRTRNVLDQFR